MMLLQPCCNVIAIAIPHNADIDSLNDALTHVSVSYAGRRPMSSQASQVFKVVRCNCGVELRSSNEQELIRTVQDHARQSHDLDLNDEQVRSMMRDRSVDS